MPMPYPTRRHALLALGLLSSSAWAIDLSAADATAGLRAALTRGAEAAVAGLGQADGFLGNPAVRIPLPGWLEKAAKALRAAGQGQRVDELETAINRAAEAAVPAAKPLLLDAVKSMSVADAQAILQGGDTSVTDFFAQRTRAPLAVKFLPIVSQATAQVDLVRKADAVRGKLGRLEALAGQKLPSLDEYVTGRALDGLFLMIGQEERKIRQDPVATGSAILKKVFGGLK